jgi:hypothetical protein
MELPSSLLDFQQVVLQWLHISQKTACASRFYFKTRCRHRGFFSSHQHILFSSEPHFGPSSGAPTNDLYNPDTDPIPAPHIPDAEVTSDVDSQACRGHSPRHFFDHRKDDPVRFSVHQMDKMRDPPLASSPLENVSLRLPHHMPLQPYPTSLFL